MMSKRRNHRDLQPEINPADEEGLFPFVFVRGKSVREAEFFYLMLEAIGFTCTLDVGTGTVTVTGSSS